MDTSEPVNNLDSHMLHPQEEEEEEVQDKEEVSYSGRNFSHIVPPQSLECVAAKPWL